MWKCSHKKTLKMKKLTVYAMTFGLFLLAIPIQLNAATLDSNPVAADSTALVGAALVNTLTIRLDEIALIDRTNLRPAERRELRREVRSINKQLKAANSGGVYVSVGALLVVIILLILLL
jgi:hypothetical protein